MQTASTAHRYVALLGAMAVGGCAGPEEPAEGAIRVTAETEGGTPDPDGYTLSLDGGSASGIGANATVTLEGLAAGDHTLRIGGLADNCSVSGGIEHSVRVQAGATVSEEFVVVCPAKAGAISVTTATSGDADLDGYIVRLGSGARHRIPANGTTRLTGFDEGTYNIELDDIAQNCIADSSNPPTIDVVAAQTALVVLQFTCTQLTGSLRVTTTTGGVMAPTGYHVVVNGTGAWVPVGLNDAIVVPRLLEGDNAVRLEVPSNCAVDGGASRTVHIAPGSTTDVAFAVNCVQVGDVIELRVTTATSGTDPDPDGYLVRLRGNAIALTDSAYAPPDGSVTFVVFKAVGRNTPSEYYLTLEGVAPNCTADPGGREGLVNGSDITEGFVITCGPVRRLATVIGQGGNADIYLMNSNGTGATVLTASSALDDDPAWSPDGSRIVFSSERDGNRDIYVSDADGAAPIRITNTAGIDDRPAWAPDGSRIAFVSNRDGNAEIYLMNVDGTNQTRLTDSPSEDTDPAWSPDSRRIAFASDRSGVPNIHVMNRDGTATVQLSFDIRGARSSQPSWSPDGSAIAYVQTVSLYGGYSTVVRMTSNGYPADGVGPAVDGDDLFADPAWSPDGGQIAVTRATCSLGSPCQYDVVVFGSSGFGPSRLLRSNVRNPAWRP